MNSMYLVPPSRSATNIAEADPFSDDTANHIQADEGAAVELDCPVTGYPIPRITWVKLKYAGHYVDEILSNNSTKLVKQRNSFSKQRTHLTFHHY